MTKGKGAPLIRRRHLAPYCTVIRPRRLLRLDVEFKCDLTCPRFAFTVFLFPGLGARRGVVEFSLSNYLQVDGEI